MNIQRFRELIEAYGTRSERWPEADRPAALIFLEADRDAIAITNELRRLDEALDADIVAQSTNLKADILHQISLTTVNRAEQNQDDLFSTLWRWLGPYANGSFVIWRPAIAACIPLLAGVYLGSVVETGSDDQLFEWEEDIYVMGLVSENEEQE